MCSDGGRMARRLSRRTLLCGAATSLGVGWAGSALARARSRAQSGDGRFVPDTNGFGFRNWSPRTQYFEAPEPPSTEAVRDRFLTGWNDRAGALLGADLSHLPERTAGTVATALRAAVVQRAGTNGHCYGMALAAQRYFEDPERIPVDRPTASDIELPTVPVEEPSAPVYEDILELQAAQYLRVRAWLGRRSMLFPERLDAEQLLRDVRSVVGTFGTATVTLFDESLYGHQVLAYGVEDGGDGVTLPVYDPNLPATAYRGSGPALRFERDGDGVSMEPYRQYSHVLFNRYDRIERAADRDRASPLDHVTVDRSTVRASLFPLALFLVDSPAVRLAVVGPDGRELDRVRGVHADRSRGDSPRVRSRYGADPGTYRLRVFGDGEATYEATAEVVDADGALLAETRTATIGPGDRHVYEVEIPESGTGTLRRTDRDLPTAALVGGAGAIGGAVAGAVGYRTLRGRSATDGDG